MSLIDLWDCKNLIIIMSDYRAILKHSKNYLFAVIGTKALAFISLPVYTHLLAVEEYGIYNVFISTIGIATVLLTLNTEVAISRYFYDAKSDADFKSFVGTSSLLTIVVFGVMASILVIFRNDFSAFLNLEVPLVLAIIPVSLYYVINSVFQQIYQPSLQSKKIAIVTSVQSYLAFILSVVVILLLKEKKYYGQVVGTLMAMIILGAYLIKQIKVYYSASFKKNFIKYILSYSLPYLPYSLSGVIIAQFGNIIIGQRAGFENAGVYGFASNIAMLMMVLISVVHSAWNPYYFQYMKDKDYDSLDKDYDLIWRITLLMGTMLSLFCYEIGMILGKSDYLTGLFVIPILVIGYCLYQWSYVYLRNSQYAKKNIWNAVVVITSGIVNVVMNSMVVDEFGIWGISLSFSISYLIMCILSWWINRNILHVYAPCVKNFFIPLLYTMPFFMVSIVLCRFDLGLLPNILIKTLLCLMLGGALFYKFRGKLSAILKNGRK